MKSNEQIFDQVLILMATKGRHLMIGRLKLTNLRAKTSMIPKTIEIEKSLQPMVTP